MDGLESSFGYLSLSENDASYFYANNPQLLKNFGQLPPGNGSKRDGAPFGRFVSPDGGVNPVNGYPMINHWGGMVNKWDNIELFGHLPAPLVQESGHTRHGSFPHRPNRKFSEDKQNNWSQLPTRNSELELFGEPKRGLNFQLYESIPVTQSGPNWTPIKPINSFTEVELHQTIKDNIERAQYVHPTPVQKYALPIVAANRDLMACAQTGSGKTAAFLLPILNKLFQTLQENTSDASSIPNMACPFALILAPTRELSCQIFDEARKFSYRSDIRPCVVYGGTSIIPQMRKLSNGCHILVATPGRLVDMIGRGKVSLEHVKYLVLDEADHMLDMGFEPQIRRIVEQHHMPPACQRQTLMFSATFPKEIQTLAKDFLHSYIFLAIGRVGSTNENISQEICYVDDKDKPDTLVRLLREKDLTDPEGLVLVFVETKRGVDILTQYLRQLIFPVTSIHGNRAQFQREQALASFREGSTPILIATAVAARGLDIPNVKHVINFDLPSDIDEYVHRIGRTGRMGLPGSATSFFTERNQNVVRDLVELLRESKQLVPAWLEARLAYSGTDTRKNKIGATNKRIRPNYGSLDYRQHGNRTTSFVSTLPMVNNNSVPNGGIGLLGNCSMPISMGAPQRYPQYTTYNSTYNPTTQQQSGRVIYRGNAGYLGRSGQFGTSMDPQASPNVQQPPPIPLFPTQPRPQPPHPATLVPQPSRAAMYQFFAAAAAAGMHISSNQAGNASTQPSNGMSVPGSVAPFHTGTYQTFHPTSMFPASNTVSGHPVVSHTRDGGAATMMFQPPPNGLFPPVATGSLACPTPSLNSTNSVGHQAVPQSHHPAALIPGNFHMPYYGQPQPFGAVSNGQQCNSSHSIKALVAALRATETIPNGSQPGATMCDLSGSINAHPIPTETIPPVEAAMASSPSAGSVKAGTVIQPIYRSNGTGDWWPPPAHV